MDNTKIREINRLILERNLALASSSFRPITTAVLSAVCGAVLVFLSAFGFAAFFY
jgi:hypothetical protein